MAKVLYRSLTTVPIYSKGHPCLACRHSETTEGDPFPATPFVAALHLLQRVTARARPRPWGGRRCPVPTRRLPSPRR
eukprot:5235028-Prymnesium_polylepis.1